MKIGENTEVKVEMYYTLQSDIEVAKNEPAAPIERLEYDLKEEWNAEHIQTLESKVDGLIEVVKSLDEEFQTILIDKNSESDDRLEELNKRLEELQNQKPKVIIKEVEVPTKKGKFKK